MYGLIFEHNVHNDKKKKYIKMPSPPTDPCFLIHPVTTHMNKNLGKGTATALYKFSSFCKFDKICPLTARED
jgi:hypothetical protein